MRVRIKTATGIQTIENVVEVSAATDAWAPEFSVALSQAYKAAEPTIHLYSAHSLLLEPLATNTIAVRRSKP